MTECSVPNPYTPSAVPADRSKPDAEETMKSIQKGAEAA